MDPRLPLLVALCLAAPVALAQESIGYPMGISVLDGPEVRAPVGETTTVRVLVFNGHPEEPRTLRIGVVEVADLQPGSPAGEALRTSSDEDVLTVPPLGEVEWSLRLSPAGEGSRWRVTLGTTEDVEGALHPVTSFVADSRRTPWEEAGPLVAWGAGGAALGGVGALLIARPGLRGALALPLVGLYTRLRRGDALSQANRDRIHALVRERPGMSYAQLMRATGLGAGVLVHHLRVLERERYVVSRRHGTRRLLYPAGAPLEEAPPTQAQARVLDALRRAPLTQAELRDRLALSQQGVSYHVQKLAREGRIREEGEGATRRWRAVEDGSRS